MFLDGLRPMIMLISKSWVPSSFNLRFFFPAFNGSASDNRPTPCIDKERQTSCTQMGNLEIVFHDFTLHFRAAMERTTPADAFLFIHLFFGQKNSLFHACSKNRSND